MPQEIWEEVDVDYLTSDTVRSRGEGGFRSPPYYSYFMAMICRQYKFVSKHEYKVQSTFTISYNAWLLIFYKKLFVVEVPK